MKAQRNPEPSLLNPCSTSYYTQYWAPEALDALCYIMERFKKKVYLRGIRAAYEHGIPIFRQTVDLDVFSPISGDERDELSEYIQVNYPKTTGQWKWYGVQYHFRDRDDRLDLATANSIFAEFYDGSWDQRTVQVLGGVPLNLPPLEDLVIMKLVAGRAKDIADLRRIIALGWSKLDRAKLLSKASKTGHARQLKSILRKYECSRVAYV
jgi:hypothetical protein